MSTNILDKTTTMPRIRMAIIDDHTLIRRGLAVFLKSNPDIEVVGEGSNGNEALSLCAEVKPDVMLMDLMMPIMDGLTATRHITLQYPDTKVIVLTSFAEEQMIRSVLQAGAIGYLLKKISAHDLANAIRAAHRGIPTYAPEITDILVRSVHKPHSIFQSLTAREREVLGLMVKGMSNNDIAAQLVVTLATTKSHVSNILSKLNVTTRTEAIILVLDSTPTWDNFYIA
ncbi:MAG: response regulator transcription factor [bacterium]|nr:response regulator transcription factor [bacterium]